MFAEIILFSALDRTLHYIVPEHLAEQAATGCRALAPLGRREAVGLIAALTEDPPEAPPDTRWRPLLALLDEAPVLTPDLLELARWVGSYYFYPLGQVIRTMLPAELEAAEHQAYRLTSVGREALGRKDASPVLRCMEDAGEEGLSREALRRLMPDETNEVLVKTLKTMERKGLIDVFSTWKTTRQRPRITKTLRLRREPDETLVRGNPRSRALLDFMREKEGAVPLSAARAQVPGANYWIRKFIREGIMAVEETEELRTFCTLPPLSTAEPPELTADQSEALDAIRPALVGPHFQPTLLYGVTGSGKTEVYLHLVADAIEQGRGALVLVPEIALSTQMETLFRQRFGDTLAVWHSGLPPGARFDQWRETLTGRRRIVLGVRSAVFMPVRSLGLIIVDEEHDASYKQDDHLRYHARDVALVRGKQLNIPVVLGSATPSLQSLQHGLTGRYVQVSMPQRIFGRPLPPIEVVDMRRESRHHRILSRRLQEAVSRTLERGEQVLLFLNRRGFAHFHLCMACGHVPQCAHCSVSLTYHQSDNLLRCHFCGWRRAVPEACPQCGHAALVAHGFGTERLEEEIRRLWPRTTLVRIDRDTAGRPQDLVDCLDAVRSDRANILIGTQMIAKGHDFPRITLVGVVNADTALQIPDFRAGENTVQLLMQVAGRAGRGEAPGEVILQTYNPGHYTIGAVVERDYLSFAREELLSRESLQYPPFSRFLRILVTAASEEDTGEAATQLAALCREVARAAERSGEPVAVLGPSPAPLSKLKRRYRWHIFIKAWTQKGLQQFTEEMLRRSSNLPLLRRRVQVAVDRDPIMSL